MNERLKQFIQTVDRYIRESVPDREPQYQEFHSFVGCFSGNIIVRFYREGHWEIVEGPLRAEANSFLDCLEQLHTR